MAGSGRNRLLRILHIDPERNWGGGEVQVLGLLKYLSHRGHRSDLLTHPQSLLFQQAQQSGITTLPLIVRNDFDLRAIPRIRKLIRTENYDLVHLHTKRAHALSVWLPAGPAYVVTRRMDYPESNNWYTRQLYNRCVDGVVAISKAIFDLLVRAGVCPGAIRLIPSGIDAQRFQVPQPKWRDPFSSLVVGTAAVLEARKGHRFLLEAARQLKAQGYQIRYRFAGEGPLRSELQRVAAELDLTREVEFLGFVSDIPAFLSELDLFVLPSLAEGLGVAVLEAMAAGKPVVASRVGGLAESVVDGATGYLAPVQDSAALAQAIARFARDPELGRAMGARAAERVRKEFTIEQMARQNENYYYQLVHERA